MSPRNSWHLALSYLRLKRGRASIGRSPALCTRAAADYIFAKKLLLTLDTFGESLEKLKNLTPEKFPTLGSDPWPPTQALFQVALMPRLASAQSTLSAATTTTASSTSSSTTAASATVSTSTLATLALPCCFASAQNATSLGPVVVLRRDDEQPSLPGAAAAMLAGAPPGAASDPTWEATLRRAATRALTWEGLAEAPFVAAYHSESRNNIEKIPKRGKKRSNYNEGFPTDLICCVKSGQKPGQVRMVFPL